MLFAAKLLFRALLMQPISQPSSDSVPLYFGLRPLVGGPSLLPLHVEVAAHDSIYDFLPQNPTAAATTAALLSGQGVAGSLRVRPLRSPCEAPRWLLVGHTQRSADELRSFVQAQPEELHLLDNSCWTLANSLSRYALDKSS